MKIVLVDVDDVTCDLVNYWLEIYNKDWNDNVKYEDVKEWDISKFIKPESKDVFYNYIERPYLYDKVKPISGALDGINKLREMGFRVIFLTDATSGTAGKKYHWLKEHGFIERKDDYVEARDKSLVKGSYLIDDKLDNVKNFQFYGSGGIGILFEKPWNKNKGWGLECENWDCVVETIQELEMMNG